MTSLTTHKIYPIGRCDFSRLVYYVEVPAQGQPIWAFDLLDFDYDDANEPPTLPGFADNSSSGYEEFS